MMIRPGTDRNPPPRGRRPQRPAIIPRPERHWYVIDVDNPDGGYCAACGLPQSNARHAERVA